MTPDTFDDSPTKETSQKVYDNLDLMRGVEVFLNFISAASLEAILRARQNRVTKSNQVLIFDQLLNFNPDSSRAIPTPFMGEALEETHSSLSHSGADIA